MKMVVALIVTFLSTFANAQSNGVSSPTVTKQTVWNCSELESEIAKKRAQVEQFGRAIGAVSGKSMTEITFREYAAYGKAVFALNVLTVVIPSLEGQRAACVQ